MQALVAMVLVSLATLALEHREVAYRALWIEWFEGGQLGMIQKAGQWALASRRLCPQLPPLLLAALMPVI